MVPCWNFLVKPVIAEIGVKGRSRASKVAQRPGHYAGFSRLFKWTMHHCYSRFLIGLLATIDSVFEGIK